MDGRTLKFLNVIDEYSRPCLATPAGRRCKAAEVINTIEELLKLYPPPTHLRMDYGPEFIAHALQEWCSGSGCTTATSWASRATASGKSKPQHGLQAIRTTRLRH